MRPTDAAQITTSQAEQIIALLTRIATALESKRAAASQRPSKALEQVRAMITTPGLVKVPWIRLVWALGLPERTVRAALARLVQLEIVVREYRGTETLYSTPAALAAFEALDPEGQFDALVLSELTVRFRRPDKFPPDKSPLGFATGLGMFDSGKVPAALDRLVAAGKVWRGENGRILPPNTPDSPEGRAARAVSDAMHLDIPEAPL